MLTSVELAVLVAFLSFLIFRQLTRLRSRAGQVEQPSAAGIPYRAERGHGVQPTFRQPLGSTLKTVVIIVVGILFLLGSVVLLAFLALLFGPAAGFCIPSVTCGAG
jgi:amino acid transporter